MVKGNRKEVSKLEASATKAEVATLPEPSVILEEQAQELEQAPEPVQTPEPEPKASGSLVARIENLEISLKEIRADRDAAIARADTLEKRFGEVMVSISDLAQPPYDDAYIVTELQSLKTAVEGKASTGALEGVNQLATETERIARELTGGLEQQFADFKDQVQADLKAGLDSQREELGSSAKRIADAVEDGHGKFTKTLEYDRETVEAVSGRVLKLQERVGNCADADALKSLSGAVDKLKTGTGDTQGLERIGELEKQLGAKANADHLENLARDTQQRLDALEATVGGD